VSATQFEQHIASAKSLAQALTGIPPPLNVAEQPGLAIDVDFADVDDVEDLEVSNELDSEQTLLLDVIAEGEDEDEDGKEVSADGSSAMIVWSIPVSLSSKIQQCCSAAPYTQVYITIDSNLLEDLKNVVVYSQIKARNSTHARMFHDKNGKRMVFGVKELEIFRSPTAWLNDDCINTGGAFLQSLLQSHPSCVILSTFIFVLVQKNELNDDELWRHTYRTSYWRSDLWIIPIHRPNHWVLCLVYPRIRQMLLFDSFAARTPWKTDVPNIVKLVCRLQRLATHHGHPLDMRVEGWTANPLSVRSP
jgi:Ulp1 protease family, C-terminal catalytic domain